jgi:two-component system, OmpR family, KDP operon response regulator KdpE
MKAPPMSNDAPVLVAVIIDDEPQIRKLLCASLTSEHYTVYEAESGQLGLMEIAYRKPDVVLLDLGLPDIDGIEVLRRLREWSKVPVIVLSVRESVNDKVKALDTGADDYLTKPFHSAELFARLRAIVRHSQGTMTQTEVITGALKIDLALRAVFVKDVEIHLTATEYALIKILALNMGKVLTQKQLLCEVWGPSGGENAHYLRVYMRHLRKKIETDPGLPKLLINEPGIGYRLIKIP